MAKKKYTFRFRRTSTVNISVEADSYEDAESHANNRYIMADYENQESVGKTQVDLISVETIKK